MLHRSIIRPSLGRFQCSHTITEEDNTHIVPMSQ